MSSGSSRTAGSWGDSLWWTGTGGHPGLEPLLAKLYTPEGQPTVLPILADGHLTKIEERNLSQEQIDNTCMLGVKILTEPDQADNAVTLCNSEPEEVVAWCKETILGVDSIRDDKTVKSIAYLLWALAAARGKADEVLKTRMLRGVTDDNGDRSHPMSDEGEGGHVDPEA